MAFADLIAFLDYHFDSRGEGDLVAAVDGSVAQFTVGLKRRGRGGGVRRGDARSWL